MIIGRDLISELGMTFPFDTLLMEWDNATTPMIDPYMFCKEQIVDLEHETLYMHVSRALILFCPQCWGNSSYLFPCSTATVG